MAKSVRTQLHRCVLEACPSDGEEPFSDTGMFYFFLIVSKTAEFLGGAQ